MSRREPTPGQMARAALERAEAALLPPPLPAGTAAGAGCVLEVSARPHGMAALLDDTGHVMGLCVSDEIAQGTKKFLGRS